VLWHKLQSKENKKKKVHHPKSGSRHQTNSTKSKRCGVHPHAAGYLYTLTKGDKQNKSPKPAHA